MQDVIPNQIIAQIQRHLRSRCRIAQQGFSQMEMDEDSVTGALGERLRTTRSQGRTAIVDGATWRWKITSQKLRGRGPKAAETTVGADGLFQIEVEDVDGGQVWRKGMLFQAKMEKNSDKQLLVQEMKNMEEITPNESLVVEYGENGYRAVRSSELLRSDKSLRTVDEDSIHNLGDMLADQFVVCTLGVRGMYYDSQRQIILVPSPEDMLARRFAVDHRISIDISKGIE
ncbi:hypothetical protein GYB59_13285 [bacterium]|nr:hypothetical protein [bacterium]